MSNDARIEQSRCFEGIFFAEIGADQERLIVRDRAMVDEQTVHFMEASLKDVSHVTVAIGEVGGHLVEFRPKARVIERKNAVRNTLGARTWPGRECDRIVRRHKRAYQHARRIGSKLDWQMSHEIAV